MVISCLVYFEIMFRTLLIVKVNRLTSYITNRELTKYIFDNKKQSISKTCDQEIPPSSQ